MYSRTQDDNGTYTSRCLHCFLTVASGIGAERDLDALEARHLCPERALADLLAQEQSTSGQKRQE
jgi:hypothetical protein